MFRFLLRGIGVFIYFIYVLALQIVNLFRVSRKKNIDDTPDKKWIRVRAHKDCVCANGSRYYMYIKKGSPENLLIYFSGGGMAWDEKSAHYPMGTGSFLQGEGFGYYVSKMLPFGLHPMKGILDTDDEMNPCKGWSVAYLPYTTGDFHIGASERTLEYKGIKKKIIFAGRRNAEKSLEYVFQKYKSPKNVIICGESAGAFGSSFYVRKISKNYPKSKILYVCDSTHIRYKDWDKVLKLWGVDMQSLYGFSAGADLAKASLMRNSEALKGKVPQLMINTIYDKVLSEFRMKILGEDEDTETAAKRWSAELMSVASEIKSKSDTYYMFLTKSGFDAKTGTTPHVVTRSDIFYRAKEEGLSVSEWISRALDGKLSDVGMTYIQKENKNHNAER